VLATRLGVTAADFAADGRSSVVVAVRGSKIEAVPIAEVCAEIRSVPAELYNTARTFFG
jgi:6-phosphofructokinase 1